jgi:FlaA1/EpsC-like NDP-sugar epimerase
LGGAALYKKQALQLLMDVGLVPVALVAANLLRFEGLIPRQIWERLAEGLPYVICAKMACLAAMRSYQGIWRSAGIADVIAVLKGSTLGSLLAAGALFAVFGLEGFSRTALVIDWMIFTGLATGSRMAFVLLREALGVRGQRLAMSDWRLKKEAIGD